MFITKIRYKDYLLYEVIGLYNVFGFESARVKFIDEQFATQWEKNTYRGLEFLATETSIYIGISVSLYITYTYEG